MMVRHITRVSEAREEAVGATLHHVQRFNWRVRAGRCVLIDSLSFAITCAITQKPTLFRQYFARYLT
jgi:hypothetical protein